MLTGKYSGRRAPRPPAAMYRYSTSTVAVLSLTGYDIVNGKVFTMVKQATTAPEPKFENENAPPKQNIRIERTCYAVMYHVLSSFERPVDRSKCE